MKANELRVGNLLNDYVKNERIVYVNGIDSSWDIIWVNYANATGIYARAIAQIKPIPLTEEWLLKFGFNEDDGDFFIERGRQGFIVEKAQDDDLLIVYREDVGLQYNFLMFIEYVHQLQNLYFALTGEELENHG